MCVCACLFVLLQAILMYMHAIPNLASQRNLVNRLYKLNIMRCATFTYHLFSGLGLGRDPGPGMNSAIWMHHTSTVLEGTYMAIIHFVLLIASFCD
jgi:hypothetical protein